MSDKIKTLLIGIFVIVALISAVYLILFLKPTVGDGAKRLRVRFSNIASINVGTRVLLAGKPVGEVIDIKEVKGARDDPTDELGRVFFFQLTLKVDSSVEVYNTDEITIATTGLMGEKTIAIIPKAPKKGVEIKNITNEIIYAQSVEPLENAIHQMGNLAGTMEEAIGNIDVWFHENQDKLSESVSNFAAAMKQIEDMVDSVNKDQLVSATKIAIDTFSKNMGLINTSLQEIQDRDMISKINVIVENFAEASEYINTDGTEILSNVNAITKDIAEGKGTLGKFIKNDDFYLRTVAVLSKIDTLMNDVNHYGVLFQYDKNWQRIRTKRANTLDKLNTPKEFKNYFETEMDSVTTSLSRISCLVEKAKDPKEKEKILNSAPFQKDFSMLLNQVEHLLDSLKLYNEQIVETINANN